MERASHVPQDYLRRFCLKGIREQQGTLLVDRALRQRVQFRQVNLNTTLPGDLGSYDVVFLRNVMIYFNGDTKRQVVARVTSRIKPGGHLLHRPLRKPARDQRHAAHRDALGLPQVNAA
jgi:chemotaxis protein methyltransferase CheR